MDETIRSLIETLTPDQKGAIAHIFNNHICAIVGNLSFVQGESEGRTLSGDVRGAIDDAKSTADRMAREVHLITKGEL